MLLRLLFPIGDAVAYVAARRSQPPRRSSPKPPLSRRRYCLLRLRAPSLTLPAPGGRRAPRRLAPSPSLLLPGRRTPHSSAWCLLRVLALRVLSPQPPSTTHCTPTDLMTLTPCITHDSDLTTRMTALSAATTRSRSWLLSASNTSARGARRSGPLQAPA